MGSESLFTNQLPVIDLSDLKPGSPQWDLVRPQILKALQEYGCFEALFDEVPLKLRKSMFAPIKEMFDFPLETKSGVSVETPFSSYISGQSATATYEGMGIEDVLIPEKLTSFTKLLWPQGNPSFSKTVRDFAKGLSGMDQVIRRMVLESFGVEKYCGEHIDTTRYTLLPLKYEGPKTGESEIVLFPHTDKNLFSILYEFNQVGGLQIQTRAGEWINVKFSPNSFIVMSGDSFHAWTNGRIHAPLHRVVMDGNETRYSVGLFASPKEGGFVKAPEELVDEEHPLLFKSFKYLEYLKFFQTEEGKKVHGAGLAAFCGA